MEHVRTYKFRIKDGGSTRKQLVRLSESVNLVWNYCNEASFNMIRIHGKWLSTNDLTKLTSGASKDLGLNAQTIQQVCREYWTRRFNAKRRKLSWRRSKGKRRSLGWIPCTNQNVKILGDRIKYGGKTFRVPRQHAPVGLEMVGKIDRLGMLHMGKAGHDDPGILLRLSRQLDRERCEIALKLCNSELGV